MAFEIITEGQVQDAIHLCRYLYNEGKKVDEKCSLQDSNKLFSSDNTYLYLMSKIYGLKKDKIISVITDYDLTELEKFNFKKDSEEYQFINALDKFATSKYQSSKVTSAEESQSSMKIITEGQVQDAIHLCRYLYNEGKKVDEKCSLQDSNKLFSSDNTYLYLMSKIYGLKKDKIISIISAHDLTELEKFNFKKDSAEYQFINALAQFVTSKYESSKATSATEMQSLAVNPVVVAPSVVLGGKVFSNNSVEGSSVSTIIPASPQSVLAKNDPRLSSSLTLQVEEFFDPLGEIDGLASTLSKSCPEYQVGNGDFFSIVYPSSFETGPSTSLPGGSTMPVALAASSATSYGTVRDKVPTEAFLGTISGSTDGVPSYNEIKISTETQKSEAIELLLTLYKIKHNADINEFNKILNNKQRLKKLNAMIIALDEREFIDILKYKNLNELHSLFFNNGRNITAFSSGLQDFAQLKSNELLSHQSAALANTTQLASAINFAGLGPSSSLQLLEEAAESPYDHTDCLGTLPSASLVNHGNDSNVNSDKHADLPSYFNYEKTYNKLFKNIYINYRSADDNEVQNNRLFLNKRSCKVIFDSIPFLNKDDFDTNKLFKGIRNNSFIESIKLFVNSSKDFQNKLVDFCNQTKTALTKRDKDLRLNRNKKNGIEISEVSEISEGEVGEVGDKKANTRRLRSRMAKDKAMPFGQILSSIMYARSTTYTAKTLGVYSEINSGSAGAVSTYPSPVVLENSQNTAPNTTKYFSRISVEADTYNDPGSAGAGDVSNSFSALESIEDNIRNALVLEYLKQAGTVNYNKFFLHIYNLIQNNKYSGRNNLLLKDEGRAEAIKDIISSWNQKEFSEILERLPKEFPEYFINRLKFYINNFDLFKSQLIVLIDHIYSTHVSKKDDSDGNEDLSKNTHVFSTNNKSSSLNISISEILPSYSDDTKRSYNILAANIYNGQLNGINCSRILTITRTTEQIITNIDILKKEDFTKDKLLINIEDDKFISSIQSFLEKSQDFKKDLKNFFREVKNHFTAKDTARRMALKKEKKKNSYKAEESDLESEISSGEEGSISKDDEARGRSSKRVLRERKNNASYEEVDDIDSESGSDYVPEVHNTVATNVCSKSTRSKSTRSKRPSDSLCYMDSAKAAQQVQRSITTADTAPDQNSSDRPPLGYHALYSATPGGIGFEMTMNTFNSLTPVPNTESGPQNQFTNAGARRHPGARGHESHH